MSKRFRCLLPTLSTGLFLLAATSAVAQNYSPLSPAFILAPYKVMATTNFGYTEARSKSTTWGTGITSPPTSRFSTSDVSQAILIGLPRNSSIGIAGAYTHSVSSNSGSQTEDEISGFINPSVSVSKTWTADIDNRLRITLYASPKTDFEGSKGFPATHVISASGVRVASSGIISSLEVSRTVNKYGDETRLDATSLGGGVYKEFGPYSVSVNARSVWLDWRNDVNIRYKNSPQYSASATVGRKLSDATSVALTYNYTTSDSEVRLSGDEGGVRSTIRGNALSLSVHVLF